MKSNLLFFPKFMGLLQQNFYHQKELEEQIETSFLINNSPTKQKRVQGIRFKSNKNSYVTSLVYLLLFPFLLCPKYSYSQVIVDSCFSSGTPGTNFTSSANLANSINSDLIRWTGSNWTGGWAGANITVPPPTNLAGCRAVFLGSGTVWTTGGEGFSVRLSSALATGQVYSFTINYISHGTGSNGSFSPRYYTNSTPTIAGATLLGNLPAVGFSWTSNTISFTATAAQNGHTWILFHSGTGSSGLISSFCSICAPIVLLPIKLLSFEAVRHSPINVDLDWAIASELNNKGFEVEKMLDNETEFRQVAFVEGAGNSSIDSYYHFLDENAHPGISYYRLKQVDFDGRFSYSDVRAVEGIAAASNITLIQNPTNDVLSVRFGQFNSKTIHIRIFGIDGKLLYQQNFDLTADQLLSLPITRDFPEGNYLLQAVFDNGDSVSKKFIKVSY